MFKDFWRTSETEVGRYTEMFGDIRRHSEFGDLLRHAETFEDVQRSLETFGDVRMIRNLAQARANIQQYIHFRKVLPDFLLD